ncbi:MAG: hypothetical protein DELT_01471 [Desulfovibrio sp.]
MSMVRKDVTIAIPCYNEEKFVYATVSAAAKFGSPVLVVDNNSTDATPQICAALAKEYANVTFVPRISKNDNVLANYERCAFLPETPYILFLRARDFVSENYISVLAQALDENPDAGLACTPIYTLDSDGVIRHEEKPVNSDVFLSDNRLERGVAFIEGLYFTPAWALYRKDVLQQCCVFARNEDLYVGADLVMMLNCALSEKWVYIKDAQYVKRSKYTVEEIVNSRKNLYLEGYKSQFGLSENEQKYPHHRLGRNLIKLLESVDGVSEAERARWIVQVKKAFTERCKKDSLPSPF